MITKKTAIDWLYSQITFNGLDDPNGQVLEEAKAMEKEQIKDAYLLGLIHPLEIEATKQSEQYYNETYGK